MSLWRDRAAVEGCGGAALEQGQVEGQVNRLLLVKRTMHVRDGFALLRRRMLAI